MQVVGTAALMGILVGVGSQIMSRSKGLSMRMKDSESVAILKGGGSAERTDPGLWVNAMRSYSAAIRNCLNLNGAPYTCTSFSTTVTDPWVRNRGTGKQIYTLDLWDMNGIHFAGTESAPVYYNAHGLQCVGGASGTDCRFQASGYMIADNASGDPGNVVFVRKLSLLTRVQTTNKGSTPAAAEYDEIDVKTNWKSAAGYGVPVGTVVPYAGTAAPAASTGYLLADGRLLSSATYPQLCAVLGTTWGGACQLPDLRGRFLRGAVPTGGTSTPAVIALQGGSPPAAALPAVGRYQTSSLANHQHTATVATGNAVFDWSAAVTVPMTATFGGGWGYGWGGGNSQTGSRWGLPIVMLNPTYAITVSGTPSVFNANISSSSPVNGSTTSAAFGAVDTMPMHVPVNYVIRADY